MRFRDLFCEKSKIKERIKINYNQYLITINLHIYAYDLVYTTHNEMPWIKTRKGVAMNVSSEHVVEKEGMKEFYKSL